MGHSRLPMSRISQMDIMRRGTAPCVANRHFSLRPHHHHSEWVKMEKVCTGSAFARVAVPFLICGICCLLSGCRSSQTIWSSEARSPDGRIVARARAIVRNSGLSITSCTETDVYLNWAAGSQPSTSILELGDASDSPLDTQVEMKWLTPTHLELTYRGNQIVGFQAAKWAEVDISLRRLTRRPINASAK